MGKTILVVEDDPLNMKLIRDVLTHRGDTVLNAGNGRKGVDLAIEKNPDLILMDIQLPVMDGVEATRLIKTDPSTRHIPVVALTGYAMDEDEKRMREAGCDGYLSKPFKLKKLFQVIDAFLATDPIDVA
ncbi:MAG: response regulator [Deltaproteobacteria bacterium]|nr:response regulator [Deltaproteobacteria bacterium]